MLLGNLLLEQNERYTYFLRICGKFFAREFFRAQRDYLFSHLPHLPLGHSAEENGVFLISGQPQALHLF
jgi:hypothetical protein